MGAASYARVGGSPSLIDEYLAKVAILMLNKFFMIIDLFYIPLIIITNNY